MDFEDEDEDDDEEAIGAAKAAAGRSEKTASECGRGLMTVMTMSAYTHPFPL